MKKDDWLVSIIKVIVAVVLIVIVATTYNRIVTLRSTVLEQYAQIENVLQSRLEKIPDLILVTSKYAEHEKEVFENVNKAQLSLKSAISDGDIQQIAEFNDTLTESLQRINTLIEGYPELYSSKLYIGLMDEMAESANRVAQERRKYNQAVTEYNNYLDSFPASTLAGIFNFNYAKYFSASPEAHTINFMNNK